MVKMFIEITKLGLEIEDVMCPGCRVFGRVGFDGGNVARVLTAFKQPYGENPSELECKDCGMRFKVRK